MKNGYFSDHCINQWGIIAQEFVGLAYYQRQGYYCV